MRSLFDRIFVSLVVRSAAVIVASLTALHTVSLLTDVTTTYVAQLTKSLRQLRLAIRRLRKSVMELRREVSELTSAVWKWLQH